RRVHVRADARALSQHLFRAARSRGGARLGRAHGGAVTLRRALKIAVFAVAAVLTLPLVAAARIEQAVSRSEAVFTGLGQLLALVPGAIGTYLRAAFFFGTLESCSWETHIGFGTLFTHRGARIARRFSTGAYCVIGHAAIGE